MADQQEDMIAQFVGMTASTPQIAQQYLDASSWDLSSAVSEFYTSQDEEQAAEPGEQPTASNQPPQPIPTTSQVPPPPASSKPPQKKKFATLNDLNSGSDGGHAGHGHDDDADSDDEDPNLFTGGEKSSLAVQNPDNLKKKILEKARRGAERPGGNDPRTPQSNFRGAARTLGGDDAPSQEIPDPNAAAPPRPQLVVRRLHFWTDGFSVDDGPLYRFDDPRNADVLAQIKQGRAPTHILNVTQDQEVDVHLEQHKENYVQPKKKFKPFEGGGQRLGSPTPGDSEVASEPAAQSQPQTQAAKPPSTGEGQPSVDVNDSEPTLSLQIRLGDGTRMVSRFNTSHTIGDVYGFVDAASAQSRTRSYVLMTTFPSKELTDKAQVLGELAEFKRGGVVVQKWT